MKNLIIESLVITLVCACAKKVEKEVVLPNAPGDLCAGKVCPTPGPCYETSQCDPQTGECLDFFMENDSPCDDGNLCTYEDHCIDGECVGGVQVTCTPLDQCHALGTCDPALGCQYTAVANNTECDDGNACTSNDECIDGICLGQEKTCIRTKEEEQCHTEEYTCNKGTAQCIFEHKPDGSRCDIDNSDPCQENVCVSGDCVRGDKTCEPIDDCHDPGVCDSNTGLCSNPVKVDGSPCNDENTCTTNSTCKGGICVSGEEEPCVSDNPCRVVVGCDPDTGCDYAELPDGESCHDGNLCTLDAVCVDGECIRQETPCPDEVCKMPGYCDELLEDCVYENMEDGTDCDDGDECTINTKCARGECQGEEAPDFCPEPSNECYKLVECNQGCIYGKVDNGTTCNDGNPCTENDECQDGVCVSGPEKNCALTSDNEECIESRECNRLTGECELWPQRAGFPCTDHDEEEGDCTIAKCNGAGECIQDYRILDCHQTPNQCQECKCDRSAGKAAIISLEGTSCNDRNPCTEVGTCSSKGVCQPGEEIDCTTSQCPHATCDRSSGSCVYKDTDCDDNNPCTESDKCNHLGFCRGTDCSDDEQCGCQAGSVCVSGECQPTTNENGIAPLSALITDNLASLRLLKNIIKAQTVDEAEPELDDLRQNTNINEAILGDYDGDGDEDLHVLSMGRNILFENDGNGAFQEVEEAGCEGSDEEHTLAAAFGDYDNDGDLDLFTSGELTDGSAAVQNRLYRNDSGIFTEVTDPYSFDDEAPIVRVEWHDIDDDGWMDLVLCRDSEEYLDIDNNSYNGLMLYRNFEAINFAPITLADESDYASFCVGSLMFDDDSISLDTNSAKEAINQKSTFAGAFDTDLPDEGTLVDSGVDVYELLQPDMSTDDRDPLPAALKPSNSATNTKKIVPMYYSGRPPLVFKDK